jgi:anti-sigma regulatory factor (Ser/Thr protein kinase)
VTTSQLHPINDRSQISGARRAAADVAAKLGFDEVTCGKVALAVTEVATNIVKHAANGRILLRAIARDDVAGLEILALDQGPGIADVGASLQDGRSSTGTRGTGLGALQRAAHSFDLYTQPGRGTALRLAFWTRKPRATPSLEVGAVCLPKSGELVSGDAWGIAVDGHRLNAIVADGLGHGPEAAKAGRAATEQLALHPTASPSELIEACHGALATTRGAAVAVVRLDPGVGTGSIAGVGNIAASVEGRTERRNLVSHHGTVGHNVRRIQEFPFAFPRDALLVLHSDGLDTHWSLSDHPGLAARHPGLIAGVLYRDHDRGRDDVTVVVIGSFESVAVPA